jgi:hypothetical protein
VPNGVNFHRTLQIAAKIFMWLLRNHQLDQSGRGLSLRPATPATLREKLPQTAVQRSISSFILLGR